VFRPFIPPAGRVAKGRIFKLQNQPEPGAVRTVVRKRRTRRHRMDRLVRGVLMGALAIGVCVSLSTVALRYLSPSLFHASRSAEISRQAAESSRDLVLHAQQEALRSMEGRTVYKYSVVPGGVRDVRELKWAVEHDPIVAAHYAGFDYDHARVVRLVLARTAYVSYRIGNKVYWTRHRVTLKKGETVLTDGKITARTRCANRVEEVPQVAMSSSEPPAMKFDEPMPVLGSAMANPAVPYQSSLLDRAGVPGLGPAAPLSLYEPFAGGTWVPVYPPPLPIGVCGPLKKKPSSGGAESEALGAISDAKRKPKGPCGSTGGGGGEVPEPGTWLLVAGGMAVMGWRIRHRFSEIRA
jgi:hypothetical protein